MVTIRHQSIHGDVHVIAVDGELSHATAAARLRTSLRQAAAEHERVVVDLTGADQVRGDVVGALAEAAAELRWRGGDLAVAAGGRVAEQLKGAGLAQALKVAGDVEGAAMAVEGQ